MKTKRILFKKKMKCVIFDEIKGRKEGNGSCKWTQTNSMRLSIMLEVMKDWYAIFTTITHDMWPHMTKVQFTIHSLIQYYRFMFEIMNMNWNRSHWLQLCSFTKHSHILSTETPSLSIRRPFNKTEVKKNYAWISIILYM